MFEPHDDRGTTMHDGRTAEEWDELATAGCRVLRRVAAKGGTTNYSALNEALAEETGLPPFNFASPAGRNAMSHLLAEVADREMAVAPALLITALVVYNLDGKSTNNPGAGFYTLATFRGLFDPKKDSKLDFWVAQVTGLHEHFAAPQSGANKHGRGAAA